MEPPGLFRGRGEHPLTGMIKRRCFAESVDVNVSLDSCPPKCMLPGHAWASVRHDPMVTWLCAWQENVQQQHKYVMLAASSSFKGKSDLEKYDKAIRLSKYIGKVRRDYTTKIKSKVLVHIVSLFLVMLVPVGFGREATWHSDVGYRCSCSPCRRREGRG